MSEQAGNKTTTMGAKALPPDCMDSFKSVDVAATPGQSFEDLFEWIITNRRGQCYKDKTPEEIHFDLFANIYNHTLITVGPGDRFEGMVTWEVSEVDKILFVKQILTTSGRALKWLIECFHQRYHGYDIQAMRYGNLVRYSNTEQLLTKLVATTKGI